MYICSCKFSRGGETLHLGDQKLLGKKSYLKAPFRTRNILRKENNGENREEKWKEETLHLENILLFIYKSSDKFAVFVTV